jgi:hypothetical protein
MAKKERYQLAEPNVWLEIIREHPEWKGLMDKEIVALVNEEKIEVEEAMKFVFARKMRKYS